MEHIGGCYCGAVRYRAREIFDAGYCHCSICRRISGAAAACWFSVREEDFALIRGAPSALHSSEHFTRYFCPACGTHLYGMDDLPAPASVGSKLVSAMLGTLDDPASVSPALHQWWSSRVAWYEKAPSLPMFSTGLIPHPDKRAPPVGRPLMANAKSHTTVRSAPVFLLEVIAVVLLGLMAGFFFAFAVDVAPAMAQLDAGDYVATQQKINLVVRNAVFGATYFGSVLLPFAVAAAVFLSGRHKPAMAWLAIGLVYFLSVFWVTRSVNVPINNELASWSAAAPPASWVQARDTWNESNLVRTVAAALCFAASVLLLAASGRGRHGA